MAGRFDIVPRRVRPHRQLARQPLLAPLSPMTAETLHSYLGRLGERNLLRSSWARDLIYAPDVTGAIAEVTGLPERHLISALPELRTSHLIKQWPYLAGQVSARAGTRPACSHCMAVRIGPGPPRVQVFARHEDLICDRHARWIGSSELKVPVHQQFAIHGCPDITAANRKHRHMINQWGRPAVLNAFHWAAICLTKWARWREVISAPDIAQRWRTLGVTTDSLPCGPEEIAAWYPNAVALAAIIVPLYYRWTTVSRQEIVADSLTQLQRVIPGIAPSGADDPFRQAIVATLPLAGSVERGPIRSEVEALPEDVPRQLDLSRPLGQCRRAYPRRRRPPLAHP